LRSVFVGTSGWAYKDWAEAFYPAGLPAARQFRFYATRFSTVEINASFYRLPTVRAFQTWKEQAPPRFIYSVKGSRAVTHYKRIEPGAKSFDILLERVGLLEEHLGPILWQLPGSFRKNSSRLAAFLDLLPTKFRHAIEFRHPSWLDDEIFGLLRAHKVACVSVSSLVLPFVLHTTADFFYLRFHGLEGGAAHDYTRAELEPWASAIKRAVKQGIGGYTYFNNDANRRAPANAETLVELIGKPAARPVATAPELVRHSD